MTTRQLAATLPAVASKIFVWHQGALGDVLLAGPALQAVAAHYPGAEMTLVGGPEQLGLLRAALPVAEIWSGQRAVWLDLFGSGDDLDRRLCQKLSQFDLALVFTPRRYPEFLWRLQAAGVRQVFWLPSFPRETGAAVGQVQAEHLRAAGLPVPLPPLRLALPPAEAQEACSRYNLKRHPGTPLVALAPGSGHPLKNWPLAYYAELAEKLQESRRAEVWWLTGPAENRLDEKIKKIPGHGQRLLKNLPLPEVAAVLSQFQLYVGNDSGVSHLAAAVHQPAVAVIFGPSDPVIWTPPGDRVTLMVSRQPCAPCATGRDIVCPENVCLTSLRPEEVYRAIDQNWPDWPGA